MIERRSTRPKGDAHQRTSLRRVRVEKLFGLYTYTIPAPSNELGQLLVMYGDNGCGKTTILRMIRHAVSAENNRGHRTALQKIPFTRFEVELSNGTTVVAERKTAGAGPYKFSVETETDRVECEFPTDKNKTSPQEVAIYERLRALGFHIYYIPDNRRIETSDKEEQLIFRDEDGTMRLLHVARPPPFVWHESHDKRREHEVLDEAVDDAINRASWWIRQQANRGSELGSVQANTIYADIAKRLATYGESKTATDEDSEISRLRAAISELVKQNKDLVRLGLSPHLGLDELLSSLETVRADHRALIQSILFPYVNGVKARFDALADIRNVLSVFVGHLNTFLTNKTISFDAGEGLTIVAQKRRLSPASLSSGERQLLLILCSALSARDDASIFIIDEPEISLNVKWQRRFLGALLDCVKGCNAQFLLASHSIELLTQYKEHVTRLHNEEG